jgi:perosamine synthetase
LETYGLDASAVRKALESNPSVVGVVIAPCYGVPCRDFHAIAAMCRERSLWLCEDACESYGSTMRSSGGSSCSDSVPIGCLATLSVISVRSEKMIGVGEGGAIVGNDTSLVSRARWWCSRAPCRGVGLWRVYEHEAVGQNFRLPEMLAAIGCAAAEALPTMIERKRAIHGWYTENIARMPGLQSCKLQGCSPGDRPVWWCNAVVLPEGYDAEPVGMQMMKSYPDVEIRPGFFPLDQQAIFQSGHSRPPCPNTDLLFRRLLCVPSSPKLCEEDIARVCSALAEALASAATGGSPAGARVVAPAA